MIETGHLKFFVKTVNSAVTVDGLFVAEHIYHICKVSSGERGFCKEELLSNRFADCTVVDLK